MIIDVTAEDVRAGIPRSARLCPIGRSLSRTFPEHTIVVYREHVCMTGFNETWKFKLPLVARVWVGWFDIGFSLKPLKFELNDDCAEKLPYGAKC